MDAEEFCLRWNNHHSVLVSVLDKLLEKESMCDVTLAAEHQLVRVHRLVLCACSSYFEEMLSKQLDKQAYIFLKDVKFADLKALVDYMYKGEVNVAQDQLSSFLQTAEALDIKGLAYKDDGQTSSSAGDQQSASKQAAKQVASRFGGVKRTAASSESPQPTRTIGPQASKQQHQQPAPKRPHVSAASSDTGVIRPETEDNFVSVDLKVEADEVDLTNEDRLDGSNGQDWASGDRDDDNWSTSDHGPITIVPNSSTSMKTSFGNLAKTDPPHPGDNNGAGPSSGKNGSKSSSSSHVPPSSVPATASSASISTSAKGGVLPPRVGCPNCLRTYKHRKHLYRHLRSGCRDTDVAARVSAAAVDPSPIYRCDSCDYTTYVKGFLQRHTLSTHHHHPPLHQSSSPT